MAGSENEMADRISLEPVGLVSSPVQLQTDRDWGEVVSTSNLLLAFHKAAKGKRSKAAASTFEFNLEENIIHKRLQQRLEQGSVSDGRWEIYLSQKDRFEPVVGAQHHNRVIIDTSNPVNQTSRQVLDIVMRST